MPKLYLRLVRAFTFSFLLIFTSFISFANAGEITVNAGSDASLTLPSNSLSLNAVASSTAGSIVSYSWAVVAGPTVYQIADNSLPSTSFSNLVEGTYSLELTVTDDAANSAKDTIIITVSTRILIDFGPTTTSSPDANSNYWNNVYAVNNGVKLSNAITTSNARTSLGLDVFNRIDGTFNLNASGLNTQNTTAVVGDYLANATTDYAYADQTAVDAGWKITGLESSRTYTIKFWGTRAVPYDCFIEIKQSNQSTWQSYNAKDNSDFNTAAVFTFTGETEMSFDIRVQTGSPFGYISLIDISRTSASDAPNLAPIAYAGNNQYLNIPNNSTSLDGSLSNDPDGTITSYQWTRISGPTQYNITGDNSAVANISNLVDGIYQFELTVTDNSGSVGTSTVTVFVGSRILFDFGASLTAAPDVNGNYWNNITTGTVGVKTTDAVNTTNVGTGIGLEVVNRIDGTFNLAGPGVNTGNTVGVVNDYINSATTDYAFADPSATNGSWKLTGLNPNQTYSVKFWGAKTITNSSRIIEIKRQDETTWQSYDAVNNTNYNNAAYFTITGQTEMSFDIRVPSGSFFGYISLIDLFYTTACVPTSSTFDTTVCDVYNWNGVDRTSSGTYTEQFTNAAGCDSTATLNLIVNNTPTVNAGTNQTINAGADATLAGSISGSLGGSWIGGTGTFSPNNTDVNATYTPSAQEIIDGSVTLTLEYVGTCGPVTSNVVITITAPCVPTSSNLDTTVCGTFNWNGNDYTASGNYSFATVNAAGCDSFAFLNLIIIAAPTSYAGPDQTIDAGATALLDGVITNAIGGFWIGGNGTYTPDNTALNAVYTPSTDEVSNGSVQLTLTSNQNACGLIAISAVTIFISPTAPITLLNFNGFKNGKSNKLTWTSANEVNNRGFEIQRSYNGVDFTKIGFVNSLAPGGNSTGNLNYQFADVNYLGSIQYYRLLQMDYDNHSKLSNVVVIKDGNLTTLTIDGIYPNPTTANISVLITSPNLQKSTVIIYDATGRTVAKQTITLNSGNNIIPFDVHNFASGTYTVNLISINSNVAGKFIKK